MPFPSEEAENMMTEEGDEHDYTTEEEHDAVEQVLKLRRAVRARKRSPSAKAGGGKSTGPEELLQAVLGQRRSGEKQAGQGRKGVREADPRHAARNFRGRWQGQDYGRGATTT